MKNARIEIVHADADNCFLALDENGAEMGKIRYEPVPGALKAVSTLVDERYRGRGVAAELLDALVAHAEKSGLKIIPVCSYVAAAFENAAERFKNVIPVDETGDSPTAP